MTKKIADDLNSIQGLAQEAEQADLTQKIDAIRAGYLGYGKHFSAVVDAKRKLGLVPDAGLEGTLRNSVHDIEIKLKEFDEPRLMVAMLTMRRHEKDFFLRRDPKYGEALKKTATDFLTDLSAANVTSAGKEDIQKKLEIYQKNFLAWMEVAKIFTSETKLTSESYEVIEPIIEFMKQIVEKSRLDAEAADAASRISTTLKMQVAIFVVMLVVMLLVFLIGRSISKPLSAMAKAVGFLADGKFKVTLPGLDRKDEVGEMGQAIEMFKLKAIEKAHREAEEKEEEASAARAARKNDVNKLADEFERAVGEIVDVVSSASTELEAAAGTLAKTADSTQMLSVSVTAASEEASTNVQSVASASEEMASSVNEIGRQIETSTRIAQEAVQQAKQTDESINKLMQAAAKIGDVVDLITTIAEQTNLLALNATIEAARAGESGKGFAVVASEVKALAAQTAKATSEISGQINEIQATTAESAKAIGEIGVTIGSISEITAAIAAAVEEQGSATSEIARNVQQAAEGTTQVSAGITEVNKGACETGSASSQVLSSAQSLSIESSRLKVEVQKFLSNVRAA